MPVRAIVAQHPHDPSAPAASGAPHRGCRRGRWPTQHSDPPRSHASMVGAARAGHAPYTIHGDGASLYAPSYGAAERFLQHKRRPVHSKLFQDDPSTLPSQYLSSFEGSARAGSSRTKRAIPGSRSQPRGASISMSEGASGAKSDLQSAAEKALRSMDGRGGRPVRRAHNAASRAAAAAAAAAAVHDDETDSLPSFATSPPLSPIDPATHHNTAGGRQRQAAKRSLQRSALSGAVVLSRSPAQAPLVQAVRYEDPYRQLKERLEALWEEVDVPPSRRAAVRSAYFVHGLPGDLHALNVEVARVLGERDVCARIAEAMAEREGVITALMSLAARYRSWGVEVDNGVSRGVTGRTRQHLRSSQSFGIIRDELRANVGLIRETTVKVLGLIDAYARTGSRARYTTVAGGRVRTNVLLYFLHELDERVFRKEPLLYLLGVEPWGNPLLVRGLEVLKLPGHARGEHHAIPAAALARMHPMGGTAKPEPTDVSVGQYGELKHAAQQLRWEFDRVLRGFQMHARAAVRRISRRRTAAARAILLRVGRACLSRFHTRVLHIQSCATRIQTVFRGWSQRAKLYWFHHFASVIKGAWRASRVRRALRSQRLACVRIQRAYRGWRTRRVAAVRLLQAATRGGRVRRGLPARLVDHRRRMRMLRVARGYAHRVALAVMWRARAAATIARVTRAMAGRAALSTVWEAKRAAVIAKREGATRRVRRFLEVLRMRHTVAARRGERAAKVQAARAIGGWVAGRRLMHEARRVFAGARVARMAVQGAEAIVWGALVARGVIAREWLTELVDLRGRQRAAWCDVTEAAARAATAVTAAALEEADEEAHAPPRDAAKPRHAPEAEAPQRDAPRLAVPTSGETPATPPHHTAARAAGCGLDIVASVYHAMHTPTPVRESEAPRLEGHAAEVHMTLGDAQHGGPPRGAPQHAARDDVRAVGSGADGVAPGAGEGRPTPNRGLAAVVAALADVGGLTPQRVSPHTPGTGGVDVKSTHATPPSTPPDPAALDVPCPPNATSAARAMAPALQAASPSSIRVLVHDLDARADAAAMGLSPPPPADTARRLEASLDLPDPAPPRHAAADTTAHPAAPPHHPQLRPLPEQTRPRPLYEPDIVPVAHQVASSPTQAPAAIQRQAHGPQLKPCVARDVPLTEVTPQVTSPASPSRAGACQVGNVPQLRACAAVRPEAGVRAGAGEGGVTGTPSVEVHLHEQSSTLVVPLESPQPLRTRRETLASFRAGNLSTQGGEVPAGKASPDGRKVDDRRGTNLTLLSSGLSLSDITEFAPALRELMSSPHPSPRRQATPPGNTDGSEGAVLEKHSPQLPPPFRDDAPPPGRETLPADRVAEGSGSGGRDATDQPLPHDEVAPATQLLAGRSMSLSGRSLARVRMFAGADATPVSDPTGGESASLELRSVAVQSTAPREEASAAAVVQRTGTEVQRKGDAGAGVRVETMPSVTTVVVRSTGVGVHLTQQPDPRANGMHTARGSNAVHLVPRGSQRAHSTARTPAAAAMPQLLPSRRSPEANTSTSRVEAGDPATAPPPPSAAAGHGYAPSAAPALPYGAVGLMRDPEELLPVEQTQPPQAGEPRVQGAAPTTRVSEELAPQLITTPTPPTAGPAVAVAADGAHTHDTRVVEPFVHPLHGAPHTHQQPHPPPPPPAQVWWTPQQPHSAPPAAAAAAAAGSSRTTGALKWVLATFVLQRYARECLRCTRAKRAAHASAAMAQPQSRRLSYKGIDDPDVVNTAAAVDMQRIVRALLARRRFKSRLIFMRWAAYAAQRRASRLSAVRTIAGFWKLRTQRAAANAAWREACLNAAPRWYLAEAGVHRTLGQQHAGGVKDSNAGVFLPDESTQVAMALYRRKLNKGACQAGAVRCIQRCFRRRAERKRQRRSSYRGINDLDTANTAAAVDMQRIVRAFLARRRFKSRLIFMRWAAYAAQRRASRLSAVRTIAGFWKLRTQRAAANAAWREACLNAAPRWYLAEAGVHRTLAQTKNTTFKDLFLPDESTRVAMALYRRKLNHGACQAGAVRCIQRCFRRRVEAMRERRQRAYKGIDDPDVVNTAAAVDMQRIVRAFLARRRFKSRLIFMRWAAYAAQRRASRLSAVRTIAGFWKLRTQRAAANAAWREACLNAAPRWYLAELDTAHRTLARTGRGEGFAGVFRPDESTVHAMALCRRRMNRGAVTRGAVRCIQRSYRQWLKRRACVAACAALALITTAAAGARRSELLLVVELMGVQSTRLLAHRYLGVLGRYCRSRLTVRTLRTSQVKFARSLELRSKWSTLRRYWAVWGRFRRVPMPAAEPTARAEVETPVGTAVRSQPPKDASAGDHMPRYAAVDMPRQIASHTPPTCEVDAGGPLGNVLLTSGDVVVQRGSDEVYRRGAPLASAHEPRAGGVMRQDVRPRGVGGLQVTPRTDVVRSGTMRPPRAIHSPAPGWGAERPVRSGQLQPPLRGYAAHTPPREHPAAASPLVRCGTPAHRGYSSVPRHGSRSVPQPGTPCGVPDIIVHPPSPQSSAGRHRSPPRSAVRKGYLSPYG